MRILINKDMRMLTQGVNDKTGRFYQGESNGNR